MEKHYLTGGYLKIWQNKHFLKRLGRDLISDERRDYKVRLGSVVASSLFGIFCGVVISSIIWFVAFGYATQMVQTVCGTR